MDDYMAIAFIRHGLTEGNEKGKYIGWSNPGLTPGGIEMLKRTMQSFEPYEVCFSSDLNRCLETSHFLFPEVSIISTPLLRELHFGKWEGLTYDDLKENEEYQYWLTDPSISPSGGEGMNQFINRVEVAWEQIKAHVESLNGNRYSVISHGGVIRYLLTSLSPMSEHQSFWEWKVAYGAGYELAWKTEEDWRDQNCTSLRVVPLMGRENG